LLIDKLIIYRAFLVLLLEVGFISIFGMTVVNVDILLYRSRNVFVINLCGETNIDIIFIHNQINLKSNSLRNVMYLYFDVQKKHAKALFSSCFFILSNYRLTSFKSFVSQITGKLYN